MPHNKNTMKKRSYRKNILREILSTPSRFFAILAITALGTGFFAGLKATGPNMRATAQHYYETQQLMDVRLLSTLGFTAEDVQALEKRDDIEVVMATQGLDLLIDKDEVQKIGRINALPKDTSSDNPAYLNQLVLTEGRMPEKKGECVVDASFQYAVGDAVVISDANTKQSLDLLAVQELTVVGLVHSPLYISNQRGNTNIGNGRVNFFCYTVPDSFESEFYTEVFLQVAGSRGLPFYGDEYASLIRATTDSLETFGEERARIRFDELVSDAKIELQDAQEELDSERKKADVQLADALAEIEDAERTIQDGWAELKTNQQKLEDAQAKLKQGENDAASGRAELEKRQAEFNEGLEQYNQNRAEFNGGEAEYNKQKALLQAAQLQLDGMKQAVQGLATYGQAMQDMLPAIGQQETPEQQQAAQAFIQTGQSAAGVLNEMAAGLAQSGKPAIATQLTDASTALTQALDTSDFALAAGLVGAVPALIQPELDSTQAQLDGGFAELAPIGVQLEEGRAQLDAAWQQLESGRVQLESGWAQLASAETQLGQARTEIADGLHQIADARKKLANAEVELQDGRLEYQDKKQEADDAFAENQQKIDDARQELEELEKPEWLVQDRDASPGYAGFVMDAERINAIAAVIPPFFFLVAALVCLTTMTRMVEEQRTQIGTFKALGFGKKAIAFKFIVYAGVASVVGSLVGVVIGFTIFPTTIWNAYRMMYEMPDIRSAGNTWLAFASVGAMVACNTAATIAACYNELRSVPAVLMRPQAPKAGQRVFLERFPFIWKHMKFSQKVTARNLFRYKKRFFMTVIGVAGCTALLVTGFGLRDSIIGIVGRQFGVINHHDIVASLEEPSNSLQNTPVNHLLPDIGDGLYVMQTVIDAQAGDKNNASMSTYLYVPEEIERLPEFITLQDRRSEKPVELPPLGSAVITEKLAKRLAVQSGDTISINRTGETPVEVTISGIAENYVYNYVYMSPATFQKIFEEEPEFKTLFLRFNQSSVLSEQEILTQLIETEGVIGAMDMADMSHELNNMLKSLDSVIWLIIASAAALAFVVLYNLTNINITERAREIATLKVLGFFNNEVASYVYRENLLLTFIGIAAGLVGGVFLHLFVINTAEIDEVMFRRLILPLSYVWSILFTLLSAMLVNIVMLRRLRKIDMVESLKSAE